MKDAVTTALAVQGIRPTWIPTYDSSVWCDFTIGGASTDTYHVFDAYAFGAPVAEDSPERYILELNVDPDAEDPPFDPVCKAGSIDELLKALV